MGGRFESGLSERAGPVRAGLPVGRLRMGRLPRLRFQHPELSAQGSWRRVDAGAVQFHADAALTIPRRRAPRRLLAGNTQQRFHLLLGQWFGQRRRPRSTGRARSWPALLALPDAAAIRNSLLQSLSVVTVRIIPVLDLKN